MQGKKRKVTGLRDRNGIWHILKTVRIPGGGPVTLQESTGCRDLREAERVLMKRVADVMDQHFYGVIPDVPFADCATKYLEENAGLKSIDRAAYALANLVPMIGDMKLKDVHDGSLEAYKRKRLKDGVAVGTLNKELTYVRRILTLAARKWRTESGQPLLRTPPLISEVKGEERKAYILNRDEERELLAQLPEHLQDAVIFALNTGLRASEQVGLKWDYQRYVPALETTVFVLPKEVVKTGKARVVPLNEAARKVIDKQRSNESEYVFTYKGEPVTRFNNHSFRKARRRAGLDALTWHSLRHTYATRLRAAQVSLEDRAALLGHTVEGGEMTTRYSAPELGALIKHVEKLEDERTDVALHEGFARQIPATAADKEAVLH